MSATIGLSGAIDPRSVAAGTVQVWHWSDHPAQVTDVRTSVSADGTQLTIDPPRTGWQRGDRYVVVVRGRLRHAHAAAATPGTGADPPARERLDRAFSELDRDA